MAERRNDQTLRALFSEELGAVIQVRLDERDAVFGVLREAGLSALQPRDRQAERDAITIEIYRDAKKVFGAAACRTAAQRGSEVSWRIARLRDNPACADSEYDTLLQDATDPGISPVLTFDPAEDIAAPFIATGSRPRVAILREQGVNSHLETAYACDRAGFDAHDVHMSDLIAGRASLADFQGVVACGGFSLRRRAGRRRRLGQDRSCSTRRWPSSSRRSSTARTPSRWASATAAR